jgi:hypothetical protein
MEGQHPKNPWYSLCGSAVEMMTDDGLYDEYRP